MISICEHLKKKKTTIDALRKFNTLRKQLFGNELGMSWKEALKDFQDAYLLIPHISLPSKVHIVFAHLDEFIEKYGDTKGLGFYSEQTGESVHKRFQDIFDKYKLKNIYADTYGKHLFKAVVEFSSVRI